MSRYNLMLLMIEMLNSTGDRHLYLYKYKCELTLIINTRLADRHPYYMGQYCVIRFDQWSFVLALMN
jgi:hypothetical protein